MSARFEVSAAPTTPLDLLGPTTPLQEADQDEDTDELDGLFKLVLGDPWSSAYVLTGSPTELLAYLDRARAMVLTNLHPALTGPMA